jgi:hypothetical protein
LHHAAGAAASADAAANEIDAVVEVEVPVEDLYFETSRPSDAGDIEVFYLLDPEAGYEVTVCSVHPWPPQPRESESSKSE